ncbi:YkvA family protein [Bacillus sp. MMSF_3328]|uniref:YkvA family protein n=1 Tax=Bacillus sp. MMSF_3328 TaxID=3047080 RepID=UPI00273FF909|nr:YkvA family protein [Bacillus sp. MMSF_3328]
MKTFKKEGYEKEYKKYESRAAKYLNDPGKTSGLLSKASKKADSRKNSLSEVWDKLQLLFELIKAYSKGQYRDISAKTAVTVIAGILYFVSPLDLVPDFLAGIGILDDAAIIGFIIKQIANELERFKLWRETQPDNIIDMEEDSKKTLV